MEVPFIATFVKHYPAKVLKFSSIFSVGPRKRSKFTLLVYYIYHHFQFVV